MELSRKAALKSGNHRLDTKYLYLDAWPQGCHKPPDIQGELAHKPNRRARLGRIDIGKSLPRSESSPRWPATLIQLEE